MATEFSTYLKEHEAEVIELASMEQGKRFITLYCMYIAWVSGRVGKNLPYPLLDAIQELYFVLIYCDPTPSEKPYDKKRIESFFNEMPSIIYKSMEAELAGPKRTVGRFFILAYCLMFAAIGLILTGAGLNGFNPVSASNPFVLAGLLSAVTGLFTIIYTLCRCVVEQPALQARFNESQAHTLASQELATIKNNVSKALSPNFEHKDAVVSAVVDSFVGFYYGRASYLSYTSDFKNSVIEKSLDMTVLNEKLKIIRPAV